MAAYFSEDRRPDLIAKMPDRVWLIWKEERTGRKDRLEIRTYEVLGYTQRSLWPSETLGPPNDTTTGPFKTHRNSKQSERAYLLDQWAIGPSLRIFGISLDIEPRQSENTETPCRVIAAARIAWQDPVRFETSWFCVEISAFSSNISITDPPSLMVGVPIVGIIGATYGTHLTAQLESWRPVDWWGWGKQANHPAPDFDDIDLNPLTRKFLPAPGGSAWFGDS